MQYTKQTIVALVAPVLLMVAVACGGRPGTVDPPDQGPALPSAIVSTPPDKGHALPTATGSAPLNGTEWVLRALHGAGLVEGSNITLAFSGGQAGGFAGCNSYGGEYSAASGNLLVIPPLEMTAEGCVSPEGVLQQEAAYIEALTDAASYRLEGDLLEIADAEGHVSLVFVRKEDLPMEPGDLVGSRWLLRSMAGTSPVEGEPITLMFHGEGQMRGRAGCRGYVATYEASGDDIRLHFLAMTGLAELCPEDLISQEGEYTTHLEQATNYRLGNGELELLTAPGEKLVFEMLPEDVDASLEGTPWTLLAFIEERELEGMEGAILRPTDLLAGTEITATFEDGTLRGSAGCNSYTAAYAADGSSLTLGAVAATEMACLQPAGAMEQEQRYLEILGDVTAYRTLSNQLWLEAGGGQVLVFGAQAGEGEGRDCTGPDAFPTEEAELVWPTLVQVEPDPAAPGEQVEILGVGGNLHWENECGSLWVESARDFQILLDGAPAGAITCYAGACRATLTVPVDASRGKHTLSAEGGSSLEMAVSGD